MPQVKVSPQIKIGAHTYAVFQSNLVDFDGNDGTVNHRHQQIYIAAKVPKTRKACAFIEEVLHIIAMTSPPLDKVLEHSHLRLLAERQAEMFGAMEIELDWSDVPFWVETEV